LPFLVAAGVVGGAVMVTSASSGASCIDSVKALDARLLGGEIPADPAVLRARNAEYEKEFAALCPAAPASEVPLDPGDSSPYVPALGIFAPAEDILPQFDFVNYWVGQVGDGYVWVYAGTLDAEPDQGGVSVMPYGSGPSALFPTPKAVGAVKIISSEGALLTLEASDGSLFTFDVASSSYVTASASPTVSAP
jgi:hypothetical protein